MNLYSVFIIMWFWNLLGWIVGIPFVIIVGGAFLYCIFYALGKVFNGLKDFVKYPQYYWDIFKKRWKKYRKKIIYLIVYYFILGTIVYFILYFINN